jgi:DNA-binding LytR/AlgR family response regulator
MKRILIIEDEALAARRLEGLVKHILEEPVVIDMVSSVAEAVDYLANRPQLDLILSDIHLTDGHAFDIFKVHQPAVPLVFCTAYDQYALEAFKHRGMAYLLKPVEESALREVLNRAIQPGVKIDYDQLAKAVLAGKELEKKRLLLRVGQMLKPVELADIAYFMAKDKAVYLVQRDGKQYPVDDTLDQLEETLDATRFYRINRRYLTTVKAIQGLYAWSRSRIRVVLHPDPDDEVLISSERVPGFRAWHEKAV